MKTAMAGVGAFGASLLVRWVWTSADMQQAWVLLDSALVR